MPLAGASFDEPAADGSAGHWVHAAGEGMTVEIDPQGVGDERNSLHLVSRGAGRPLWVRSHPFAAPTTGRVRVVAKIRLANPAEQPPLRVAIESRLHGQVYYRWMNYGRKEREADRAPPPLAADWTACVVVVDDLPLVGLSDFRVGFDLMGDGEVWIDNVEVFDLWLQEKEYDDMLRSAPVAKLQASSGRLAECRLFIDGYWPTFLRQHVPLADPPASSAGGGSVTKAPAARAKTAPISGRAKLPLLAPTTRTPPPAPKQPAATADSSKSWLPSWLRWK
jgi:hypothetical protein